MRRYSGIMSVLLTLALPVAATCAETPKAQEKADTSIEASKAQEKGAAVEAPKAPQKGAAPADASKAADKKPSVEEITETMSKTGHAKGMSGKASTVNNPINPSGKVVETMDGGGYTYANLEKDGKKTWVAFPTLETRVGEQLSFSGCMEMNNFQSKALNRKFDSIMFCGSPEVKPASSTANAMAGKKSPGSTGATATTTANIKVDKATGANAYTVGEIFEKREKLNGKQVVVRGQVVKVSSGIMNKNWIHLQDGTGNAKKKTNDLVVTSSELPKEGDVVTASGTVVKDKDFGSGYKYNVIIEKGAFKK